MEIENLPSDKNVIMDITMHSLFCLSGCEPACHCCNKLLPVGSLYKLSSVKDSDIERERNVVNASVHYKKVFASDKPHSVMLCDSLGCTPNNMIQYALLFALSKELEIRTKIDEALVKYAQPETKTKKYGCFIVDGVIITK